MCAPSDEPRIKIATHPRRMALSMVSQSNRPTRPKRDSTMVCARDFVPVITIVIVWPMRARDRIFTICLDFAVVRSLLIQSSISQHQCQAARQTTVIAAIKCRIHFNTHRIDIPFVLRIVPCAITGSSVKDFICQTILLCVQIWGFCVSSSFWFSRHHWHISHRVNKFALNALHATVVREFDISTTHESRLLSRLTYDTYM